MSLLKDLKLELKQRRREDAWSQNDVAALNKAYVRDNPKCEKCGTIDDPTVDHIVPKSLMMQFGIDTTRKFDESWVRTLCYKCNHFKAGKLDFTDPRTKILLLEFINKI